MITKKRQLEMALQAIPSHPHPDPNLEQYHTPASIAADVVWNAQAYGDLRDMKVVDLGCGTGILALGVALMGAVEVVGVDVDIDALQVANSEAVRLEVQDKCRFLNMDMNDFHEKADTVIQNPPFGAQKAHRKDADRRFLEKALEVAPVIYSFHLAKTREFLEQIVKALNSNVTHVFNYNFPLPRIYHFHQDEKREVEVVVLRIERME
ncbi:METTL5 family protein [Methanobacterium sp.]|uniref:METTL5 family protein n=1 Tax=Methanobacterium sp. TaxID=2164 RepID=UPI0025E08E20|nr:METTL5 family protein [Methanobacterium sp.]MBI5459027.1 methyltransferase [Methanobacterium sp.]